MRNILKDIWFYLVAKFWFWLFNTGDLEATNKNALTHSFTVYGKTYRAVSREVKFRIVYDGKIVLSKEYSVYQIRMKMAGDSVYTEDWYPLLVPAYLKEINYDHTQAVRIHWQRYYSYRKNY